MLSVCLIGVMEGGYSLVRCTTPNFVHVFLNNHSKPGARILGLFCRSIGALSA